MKLTFLFIAAVVLCVTATPVHEVVEVRSGGCDASCQAPFTPIFQSCAGMAQNIMNFFSSSITSLSVWINTARLQMYSYSFTMNTMMANVQSLMTLAYGQTQLITLTTYINAVTATLSPIAQLMIQIGTPGATTIQQQVQNITATYQLVLQAMGVATSAAGAYNTLPLMSLVNSTTVQMLTTVMQQTVQIFQVTMETFSNATSSNTSAIGFYLMDAVMSPYPTVKAMYSSLVQSSVQITTSNTQIVQSNVISVQVSLMNVVKTAVMTEVSSSKTTTNYAYSVFASQSSSYVGLESFVTSSCAEMQLATTDLEAETNQNITETQEEFFAMCEDSEDADNITQTVNNVTTKITECVQTSTSVTVQMCANVAIQALLVKQTTAHQQIGHCVSEGKAENEKDMNEIKESFKQSCSHNHEQLKHCADKHKPGPGPHKRGPASDSDSGETPAEKCESCKKKHCDKGKAHKEHSHEKCKKHKKGGEHHEKVKKCKKDSRTTTITEIQAIVATFNICASVTITL